MPHKYAHKYRRSASKQVHAGQTDPMSCEITADHAHLVAVWCTKWVSSAFNAQKCRVSRDPGHAHLGAVLCINFVVLLRRQLYIKFECSIFKGARNK